MNVLITAVFVMPILCLALFSALFSKELSMAVKISCVIFIALWAKGYIDAMVVQLKRTKDITVGQELKVGDKVWQWEEITQCNLDTSRPLGIWLPRRYNPDPRTVVLVINNKAELRIFYDFYTDKERLLKHLETVLMATNPAVITRVTMHSLTSSFICPQCVGKTYMNESDAKRRRTKWVPGNCPVCAGAGNILARH